MLTKKLLKKKCLSKVLQDMINENQKGIILIDNKEEEKFVSYQELHIVSQKILYHLQSQGFDKGDEVIFQIDNEEHFIYFAWACILGGMVPVPLPAVKNHENIMQLSRIWSILRRPRLISTREQYDNILSTLNTEANNEIANEIKDKTLFDNDLLILTESGNTVLTEPNDTAFIVFSSGSTGEPKGIVLTHEKILHAMESMGEHLGLNDSDVFLNWMPMTHVIGLALFHVLPLAYEKKQVIISKELFIKKPVIWMEKADQYRATILIAPNIGFRQFLNSFKTNECRQWNLSHIRTIMASAEPVSGDLAEQFITTLSKFGLKPEALSNLYGMSESVLGIACTPQGEPAKSYWLNRDLLGVGDSIQEIDAGSENGSLFVSSGVPIKNCWVRICDDVGNVLEENQIGHVQVTGNNIINQYYTKEATTKSFTPDGWLISGDIGFLKNGHLTITGRAKDMIIIHGQNFYASDIERVAASIANFEFGKVAACGIFVAKSQAEKAVLFVEHHSSLAEFVPLAVQLKTQLSSKMGIEISWIIPVNEIPKTGSGKIQRYKLAKEYLDGHYTETQATLESLITNQLSRHVAARPESALQEQLLKSCLDVLSYPNIGIDDNLFDYGLHSITMAAIITKINNTLHHDLSFTDFIANPSIRALENVILQQSQATHFQYPQSIPNPADLHQPFPLTGIQEAYLIGRNEDIEMGGVCTHFYHEIETEFEISLLNLRLQKLISAYPMMRAIVRGTKIQEILESVPDYKIEEIDIRGLSEKEQQEIIFAERTRMSHYVFETDKWPLFEFKALKLTDNINYLFVSYDLIIADAASILTIGKNLVDLYKNPDMGIVSPEFSFRDYVMAYEAFKESDIYKRDQNYWQKKVENFPDSPALPYKNNPENIKKPKYKRVEKRFNRHQWSTVKTIAQSKRITASSLLCAAFIEVLSIWSNQKDLAINLTTFNTLPFHKDATRILGDFTSVLPLAVHINNDDSFWNKASKVQTELMEVLEHRNYDGIDVIREIARYKNIGIGKSVLPIVFSSILFEEGRFGWSEMGKIKFAVSQTPQVYIDVQIMEDNGELSITWDYIEQLFELETINRMFAQYTGLLEGIVQGKEDGYLSISEADQHLIQQYNSTREDIPAKTLHGMFMEQACQTPENVAVIYEDENITYQELDKRSNQIARYLNGQAVGRGDYVGVLAHRRIETIVNMMGILKAGAAYIPLNPEHPEDRRNYILENAGARMQLTPETYEEKKLSKYNSKELKNNIYPDDVAYVIYTSGSTGRPKGVVIKHRAAANTIQDINRRYNVNQKDRIIGLSSMCFDLSVYDIFGALSTGAALVMINDQRDVRNINEVVQKHGITIWNSVPAIMDMFVENIGDQRTDAGDRHVANMGNLAVNYNSYDSLRLVMLSGDWIPLALPEKIRKNFINAEVVSLGGATEASIWSIYYPIGKVEDGWKSIPYGMPLANQTFYVLNYKKKVCPVGVAGDLYIGGVGLAEGYLNDEEKTREAFIMHPEFGRLYKTGDYGVLHREGYIEFLGRKDFQVKIRGYRVELGEIENQLLSISNINNAIVIDRTDTKNKKYICAYYTSDKELLANDLKVLLSKNLPDYMIPTYFIRLKEIPLTQNGKVDRKTLPEPEIRPNENEFIAPTNEIEQKIEKVWCEVLELDRIGVHESLFDLGGNSISMIKIIAKMKNEFNIGVNIGTLLENPTISGVAEYCNRSFLADTAENNVKGSSQILRADSEVEMVRLPLTPTYDLQPVHGARRTVFGSGPIKLQTFGRLLSLLRQETINGEAKYLYPSSGGLYAVQVYIYVKPGAIEGVTTGTYYYSPTNHALYLIDNTTIIGEEIHHPKYRSLYNRAGFCVFLVANMDAIRPIYSTMSTTLVALDTGYICQLLLNLQGKNGVELCLVEGVDFDAVKPAFKLEESHVFMHCLLGGLVYEGHALSVESQAGAHDIALDFSRTGITDHFRIPPESIHKQDVAGFSKSGQFNVLTEDEHILFHKKQLNIRRFSETAACIPLGVDQIDRYKYLYRSSQRSYLKKSIPLTMFCRMLSLFRPISSENGTSSLYPAAGDTYAVQTYLYIKPNAVEGLEEGIYFYDPKIHALIKYQSKPTKDIKLSHYPGNRSFYEHSGFCIFHIASLNVLRPVYGDLGIHFAMVESGCMGQLLMDHQHEFNIGVCPVGGMNFELIAPDFKLEKDQVIVQSFIGGYVDHQAAERKYAADQRPEAELKGRLSDSHRRKDIAIIGISGRFPGAQNPEKFWENIKEGRRCISQNKNDNYCGDDKLWGGFLSSKEYFDSLLFNISPAEAKTMDPQARQFLESVWECLENAGYTGNSLNSSASKIGVFVGVMWGDYHCIGSDRWRDSQKVDTQAFQSHIANRVSHFFNFKGPSLVVDTACSSALTAFHLACESIRRGECEAALVGGINIITHPYHQASLRNFDLLSTDNRCCAFGAEGTGWVAGEGVGTILIRPLDVAELNRDHIQAVIKGTTISHSGRSARFGVASTMAQANSIMDALNAAGVPPESITYVEAAATGANLADAIEMNALVEVFTKHHDRTKPCIVGSVKPNIGHLESASTISQVLKVIMQMKNRMIAPTLDCDPVNPLIQFEGNGICIAREFTQWCGAATKEAGTGSYPLRALINSFGSGGTNGHVILEAYDTKRNTKKNAGPVLVPISAASNDQLRSYAQRLYDFCINGEGSVYDLGDIAFTLQVGRVEMKHRLAVIAESQQDLCQKLNAFLNNNGMVKDVFHGQQKSDNAQSRVLVTDVELFSIAPKWVEGASVKWPLDDGYGRHRVPLPNYPFAKEIHLLPLEKVQHGVPAPKTQMGTQSYTENLGILKDRSGYGEEITRRTRDYIIKTFAELSGIPKEQLEFDTPLENYGINSLLIKKLNLKLTEDLGDFSQILFFEVRTLSGAAQYLVEHHAPLLESFFGGIEPSKDLRPIPPVKFVEACEQFTRNVPPESVKQRYNSHVDSVQECEEIAIIGLSGCYPMAKNIDEFWTNLVFGKDCITEIPVDRWDYRGIYMPDKNKSGTIYCKWGGFIEDFAKFDPLFFNMSPNEAALTDPQERLFLQVAWEALEDSGYTRTALKRDYQGNVGVFVGAMYAEYQYYAVEKSLNGQNIAFNATHGWIANHVSYFLDLNGPSMSVDTVCSSALTALHLAAESIRRGECKMAIVGGVNLNLHPNKYILISQFKMASAQGRCKPFGKDGDGFVPSEGVGAVILKPLAAAKADNDHIYGVIKATAVNHDGKTNGFTVPNPQRQAQLIQNALRRADIDPRTISYIEAHGTGTSLGDPIEIGGLTQAFGKYTQDRQFCAIGSVKSNIGHAEAASGMAGLTKVLLQMEQEQLVPSIHTQQLNENIKFEDTPFYVQREFEPWERPCIQVNGEWVSYPRRAGISSFGSGGANAHIILEEYQEESPVTEISNTIPQIILLSAKNEANLKVVAKRLYDHIYQNIFMVQSGNELSNSKNPADCRKTRTANCGSFRLIDVAYTLQVGRERMEERLAILTPDFEDLCAKLKAFCEGKTEIEGLTRSSAKIHGVNDMSLFEGEEGESFVRQLVQNKKLSKLIQLWGTGVEIDWRNLHSDLKPRRISLPTYPFETKRYWLPEVEKFIENDKNRVLALSQKENTHGISGNFNLLMESPKSRPEIQYFIKKWREKPYRGLFDEGMTIVGDILVFENEDDLSNALRDLPKIITGRIIRVKPGKRFTRKSDILYCIDPEKEEDYNRLFSELEKSGFSFGSVIHCWSFDRFDGSDETVKIQLTRAFNSVYYICCKLISITSEKPVKLLYMYASDPDGGQPLYQAMSGFARSLNLETSKLKIQTVEFPISPNISKLPVALISQAVIENLRSTGEDCIELKCLNGKQLISGFQSWRPAALETDENLSAKSFPIKKNGCYLLTGGAGGLGLIFARYLVHVHQAKVMLVGRSEQTAVICDQLNQIEAPPGRAVYFSADISKNDQVTSLINDIKAQFGEINGVFHCAGVISDALVYQKKLESVNEVFAPKVQGTIYLDKCLQEENLDFFVLFSSVTCQLGNIGQSDYAYANRFMDSFATWREWMRSQGRRHGSTISISWPLWEKGGMSVDNHTLSRIQRTWGMSPLSTESGLEAFETVIREGLTHVMVMVGEMEKIYRTLSSPTDQRTAPTETPVLPTGAMEPMNDSSEVIEFLREKVSELTGMVPNEVDNDLEFWDIGINSILAMQIIEAIGNKYGLNLYPNELYEHNTVKKLGAYLRQELTNIHTQVAATGLDQRTAPTETSVLPTGANELKEQNIGKKLSAHLQQEPAIKMAASDTNTGVTSPMCFILSTPRAGSTLLRVMLMGNSRVFAPPELHLLQFESLKERKENLQQNNTAFLRDGLIETIKVLENIEVNDAIRIMEDMEDKDLSIAETYRYLGEKAGDRILVDKSPSYGEDLNILRKAETFGNKPYYIFLVRHPLSMMASFVKNRFDKMLDVKENPWLYAERLWVKINTNIMKFLANIPDDRKFFIRYEDLVGAPEETMGKISRWLGVDFENGMLEPYRDGRMIHGLHQKSITIGDPGFLKHKAIEPGLADAWKAYAERLQGLENATIALSRQLGYSTQMTMEQQKILPLSPAQQSIIKHLGCPPYWGIIFHLQVKLDDSLNLVRFNESIQKVIEKHSMLSYAFTPINNELIQRRQDSVELVADYKDLSSCQTEEIESRLKEMETELLSRLNIVKAPLMAIGVAALGENQYAVVAVFHMLIVDGHCCEIILEDIFRQYQDPNTDVSLMDNGYEDYVETIESMKKNHLEDDHLQFWLDQIDGPITTIPADYQAMSKKVDSGEVYFEDFSFEELLTNRQVNTGKLFLYFSVGLYRYLSALNDQISPIITHRFNRRNLGDYGSYYNVVGRFAGDVPLRFTVAPNDSINTLIRDFQKFYSGIPLQGLTYEMLANKGKLPAPSRLAPILLNFQYGAMKIPSLIKSKWHQFEKASDERPYDIDLIVRVRADSVRVIAKYSNNLYECQSIERHIRSWIENVKEIIAKD